MRLLPRPELVTMGCIRSGTVNVRLNVIGVLPREVTQAVMVPTAHALRSWVGDVGKELPRTEPVVCVSFRVD